MRLLPSLSSTIRRPEHGMLGAKSQEMSDVKLPLEEIKKKGL